MGSYICAPVTGTIKLYQRVISLDVSQCHSRLQSGKPIYYDASSCKSQRIVRDKLSKRRAGPAARRRRASHGWRPTKCFRGVCASCPYTRSAPTRIYCGVHGEHSEEENRRPITFILGSLANRVRSEPLRLGDRVLTCTYNCTVSVFELKN
ncbi:hypothetical protein EVAR_43800_1 [Eumeta japonica]|uniref:Uncharacterized protein n=1 Tax=Eumeta variegata TaxID=151549 RepID=A0A4C1XY90_EUMVA|nr:hypothetical protein EVAR_43800_1 [Eumeta japonica]